MSPPDKTQTWIADLVHKLGEDVRIAAEQVRPILTLSTAAKLDELRRHRHWMRHAYGASFDWNRLEPTVRGLQSAVQETRTDVDRFIAFVQADQHPDQD